MGVVQVRENKGIPPRRIQPLRFGGGSCFVLKGSNIGKPWFSFLVNIRECNCCSCGTYPFEGCKHHLLVANSARGFFKWGAGFRIQTFLDPCVQLKSMNPRAKTRVGAFLASLASTPRNKPRSGNSWSPPFEPSLKAASNHPRAYKGLSTPKTLSAAGCFEVREILSKEVSAKLRLIDKAHPRNRWGGCPSENVLSRFQMISRVYLFAGRASGQRPVPVALPKKRKTMSWCIWVQVHNQASCSSRGKLQGLSRPGSFWPTSLAK